MFFGDYLVQQRILSAHQVLKALDVQRRRRKFIPLLLVDLGVMEDHRALKLCTISEQNHQDFLDIMLDQGIISQQQFKQIKVAWARSGPPLGQILVELGFIDDQARNEALQGYEEAKADKLLHSANI